ncbi:MAG: hypothetical protein LQ340_000237 [Diploschistes diacapsis]|nr:MAG: hypothetical protein LQ340_000237 [Diploschistes diacapsis]
MTSPSPQFDQIIMASKDPTSKVKVLYLPSQGPPELRTISDQSYTPTHGQSLVRVLYSGINPADLKHRSLGIHSTIVGYDYCGQVLQSSPGSPFKPGDMIAGCTPSGVSRLLGYGTHQARILAVNDMAFKVPPNLPLPAAGGLTVCLRAAIVAIHIHLRLPLPWSPGTPGPILIWGGASVVGSCALQLAKASGCHPIYTTASPHHHTGLLQVGATRCFDYRAPDVVSQIRAAAASDSVRLTMAFDAVGLPSSSGLEIEYYRAHASEHMAEKCFDALDAGSRSATPPRVVTTVSGGSGRARVLNAMPDWDVDWDIPGHGPTVLDSKPKEAEEMLEVIEWVAENYGKKGGLRLLRVKVVEWEDAVAELERCAEGGTGGEKVVIKH